MLAWSGDQGGGAEQAHAALDALHPEKHSLALRLLMPKVEAV